MNQYSFDTSALMDAWVRYYPKDVFPSLWTKLEGLIDSKVIVCPEEVLVELEKKEDELYRWAKNKKQLFYPLDLGLQKTVIEIQRVFPGLSAQNSLRHHADPFVVGLAMMCGYTVVTGEKSKNSKKLAQVSIPQVCIHYKIRYMNILDFIREQAWNF